jgi:hypothetical protein
MNRIFFPAAFSLGAMAVVWVAFGFFAANPLALLMTLVIGAVYGIGALELLKFRRATATLTHALAHIPDDLPRLGNWLATLDPSLQNAVRLRVEGERAGLPGPALTPYLVGLLVMLGMLGTFLGMVLTLNGAVFALEGTTDLQAMRSSLAAPIKGLGLAFGTSLAGVATSAMLGLISALVRRERLHAGQVLDGKIATVLRSFSLTHQRQETFKALQLQSQALPGVVHTLQTMMALMERQSQQLNERLLTNQDHFHGHIKGVYTELASSVDQSLKASLTTSARVAAETIKPLVEATMVGLTHEAAQLHDRMISTTQTQLGALSTRVGDSLHAFTETFERRSSALVTSVGESFAAAQAQQAAGNQQQMATWTQSLESIAFTLQREWQQAGAQTLAQQQQICTAFEQTAHQMTAQAQAQDSRHDTLVTRVGESLHAFGATFEERSTTLVSAVSESYAALQATQTTNHQAQLATWTQSLESIAATLQREWQQAGAQTLAQQQKICTTLEATAQQITEQAKTNTNNTLDEITRLLDAASEAPRAAAEVICQLRQELSSSMARDNVMLEERSRILETLSALLDAINHASAEQRITIDALVTSSEALMSRVGNQFIEKVDTEAARLSDSAAHVTSSAVEVGALSESFNFAVQLFNTSNEKLIANLQRIETAMDKSMARSDDQLAYYVAQAREIIDLSIMSQKEVFDDLRTLRSQQASLAEEVA